MGNRDRWAVVRAGAPSLLAMSCGAPAAAPAAPAPAPPAIARGPTYRFIPTGTQPVENAIELTDGSVAVVSFGRRVVVRPDGTEEGAPSTLGSDSAMSAMGGVPIPARLGGGYLFWQQNLERSRTFLGPRSAIAPLATNVIDVEFGHDALVLFGPDQPRRAYALDPPRPVPLSPHGVVATAGADDDRVVALDAAGRALVSVDGSKTWKDVTAELHARPDGVFGTASEVAFVFGKEGAWLAADGTLARRPVPAEEAADPARIAAHKAAGRLYRTVLFGWPLDDGHALGTEGSDVVTVDLATGEASNPRPVGPPTSSCVVLSPDHGGIATCHTYSVHGRDALDVVVDALGAPRVDRSFPHHPMAFADEGMVVVWAPCDPTDAGPARSFAGSSPPVPQACVRNAAGAWQSIDATAALGQKWQVLGWVAREGGGLAAVVWASGKTPVTGTLDLATGTVTAWDAAVPGAANPGGRWIVGRDGWLRGFTRQASVAVDPRGHVERGARAFAAIAASGARALGRDDEGAVWQTTDRGGHWVEVARPPYDAQGPFATFPSIECGHLGCVVAHGSGYGSWIRLGWPVDRPSDPDAGPPGAAGRATAPLPEAGAASPPPDAEEGGVAIDAGNVAAPAPPAPVSLRTPRLVCKSKADVEAGHAPPIVTKTRFGTEVPETIGGIGGVALGTSAAAGQVFVTEVLRDRFDGPVGGPGVSSTEHALRAVVRFEAGPNVDGRWTVAPRSAIEAVSLEPFDPLGRALRAAGNAGAPAHAPVAARPNAPRGGPIYGEEQPGPTRPVLDAVHPGEAAGLILRAGDRMLWITPSGAVRDVHGCPGRLEAFGGVVDAHGKLLVACEEYSRAVAVVDAETGATRLQLPGVLPWVWQPEAKMPLYGGGAATFLPNPDAIAVRHDGQLAILRLPSVGPSTVDDPAWLLTPDGVPVELAPWSTIEPASSPACTAQAGADESVRALVQTAVPWVEVEGARGFWRTPGMTAIVRWSRQRVCLEAVEAGYRQIARPGDARFGAQVMAVARFVGAAPGGGFVGMTGGEAFRARAACRLEP